MKRSLSSILLSAVFLWAFADPVMAVSTNQFKINGFFDLEYELANRPGADPTKSPVGDEHGSFDQYHFNLLMEFPVSDTLTVKGHIEYEHTPKMISPGGKGEINVEWAYVEYLLNNNIRLRGGSVLTPFGLYNENHDATPTYLSTRTPWSIYRGNKVGGTTLFPKFSTGLFVLGNFAPVEDALNVHYVAYVANGENSSNNEAEKDDNSNKAVGGRVMVSPIPALTLGGSYFTGKKQTGPGTEDNHTAWAGSLEYLIYPLNLRAEYASSKIGSITQVGWYGEVSYLIRSVTPFIRYGVLDPNDSVDKDQWREWVYGLDYQFQPNVVLKIEDRRIDGDSNNTVVNEDYNELAAALTVGF